jgi:hypothetical protein
MGVSPMAGVSRDFDRHSERISTSGAFFFFSQSNVAALLLY